MLRIRLQRPGKSHKGRIHYKLVVMEGSHPRDSRFVADLGHYHPQQSQLVIDVPKYEEWVKKGANPTETIISLVKRYKKNPAAPLVSKPRPKKKKAAPTPAA